MAKLYSYTVHQTLAFTCQLIRLLVEKQGLIAREVEKKDDFICQNGARMPCQSFAFHLCTKRLAEAQKVQMQKALMALACYFETTVECNLTK